MYDISVPIIVTAPTFNKEKTLDDIRLIGAKRVFLAIPFLSHNEAVMNSYYDALRNTIPFFKENGIEVGVWFWTFRFEDVEARYTVMVTSEGKKCHTTTAKYCPLDEGYLTYMENHVKTLADMHPDLIMFDDDFAFGFASMAAPSCYCELHRKKMAEFLEVDEVPEPVELYEKMFSGKKNAYRSAFLKSHGYSLENLAKRVRAAVDSVDPSVRMGQCACITTFDYDGIDSFTVSKLLAGNTKPFLRLICAPYWDPVRLHGNYLCDVIELERMERAWYDAKDIEIFTEGDTYPRPRHRVPASYLEIFDAALRADGNMDGILKYVFSYNNNADYERGYINAHIRNSKDLKKIEEVFSGLCDSGVRVYESMKKIENADYSRDILTVDLIRYQFFSRAVRFLSHNSIPAAHRGRGCAGIAFGENVRYLDDGAFEKPLIIDESAAYILTEKGIDVGVEVFGKRFIPTEECYLSTGEHEAVTDYRLKPPFAADLVLKESAKVESTWTKPDGTSAPASFRYTNSDGQTFLVFCLDAFTCADEMYKNYSRQKQMLDFLADSGAKLPAIAPGNPDLYVICKESEDKLAVGLFNCFADEISDFEVALPEKYSNAEFFRCDGKLSESGNGIRIDRLAAFGWCFIELKK